jgi:hypothetical protein
MCIRIEQLDEEWHMKKETAEEEHPGDELGNDVKRVYSNEVTTV